MDGAERQQLGSDGMPSADLAALPMRGERNIAVRLTPAGYRALGDGHPWIYADSIAECSHVGAAGDLAVIFDRRRRFAAIGLFDPTSHIRVRVLQRHRQATIDRRFWARAVTRALDQRAALVEDPSITGFRVLNGEGDGVGGLVADLYDSTVVIKLYTAAWLPHLADVVGALHDVVAPRAVVLRLSRQLAAEVESPLADGVIVSGTLDEPEVEFQECGLRFVANVVDGPKTGHFFDQREHRRAAARHARGARMLDVCCSTGGFALYAAAAGATHVDAVDVSPHALAATRANFDRNLDVPAVAAATLRAITGDAFGEMARLARDGRCYDLVVVDPPSFAHREQDIAVAAERYAELAALAAALVARGGVLVQASCSSRVNAASLRSAVLHGVAAAGRRARSIELGGHALDHPFRHREGEYLAVVTARLD